MDESDSNKSCAKLPLQNGEKFKEFLQKMSLTNKYPQKLSLKDAMTIREETLGAIHTTDKLPVLPYLILQKIMMCNQRCRSCLFQAKTSDSVCSDSANESSDSASDDEDDSRLHPVDCILAILHCCDDILRQHLISKLSVCQLAVPFLLPNPVDNSLTFLLWAMRSMIRGWKCYKTGEQENRIVDYPGPIISFLRIGTSELSKSEILNAVISDESKSFFFRRGCQGGDCERNFVEGLVEMSCYFPAGKGTDTDAFPVAVTFLNLRGDAQHHDKQVNFLQKISFVSVVLIAEANIDINSIKILENLAKAPKGIVLLLTEGRTKKTKELLNQAIPKDKCIKIRLKSKSNVDTIKTEIQKALRENLDKKHDSIASKQFPCISDCCVFANKAGISIDENTKDSNTGREYAEKVMRIVYPIECNKVKEKMLPLQGPKLWHQWAKYDKERYRHVDRKQVNVIDYNGKIDTQKAEVRKEQIDKCKTLTPLMKCFMWYLVQTNGKTRMYFLQWLKLLLDDHSRNVLPRLNNDYRLTRDKLLALKQKPSENDSEIRKLTKSLKEQNEELVCASFGIEHLLREICHIYESMIDSATHSVSEQLRNQVKQLPQIMAEIMDEGHALELMDGDASHVPKLWVLAVIENLKAVCGKNAREENGGKIFVLSVLGIQSSDQLY